MIGEIVSHYRIIELLGSGGMGVVYLAEDVNLHRQVALKFLSGVRLKSQDSHERLAREARAACLLDHPNIVTIYELGYHDGQPFIAMAYVAGMALSEYLKRGKPDFVATLHIAHQIGLGLQAAHRRGIAHLDIKPGNILITEDGNVKITDFGLAQMLDSVSTGGWNSYISLPYMSPEQAVGNSVDVRSDIYSLGVVMYEMLTGALPYGRSDSDSTFYSILNDPIPAIEAYVPDQSSGIGTVISRSLEKDPADRFQSATEFLDALNAVAPRSIPSQQAPNEDRSGWHQRRSQIGWLATAALLIALAVVAVLNRESKSSRGTSIKDDGRVVADSPKSDAARILFERGKQFWDRGYQEDVIRAGIRLLSESIALDSTVTESKALLSMMYTKLRIHGYDTTTATFQLAEALATECYAREPRSGTALTALGGIFYCRREYQIALRHFREAAIQSPSSEYVHMATGLCLRQIGCFDGALEAFRKELQLAPTSAAAAGRLGNTFRILGEFDSARVYLDSGLALDPQYSTCFEVLADVHLERDVNTESARRLLAERGSTIDDWTIQKLSLKLAYYERDWRSVERFVNLRGADSADIFLMLGHILRGDGQLAASHAYFDRAKRTLETLRAGETLEPIRVAKLAVALAGTGMRKSAIEFGEYAAGNCADSKHSGQLPHVLTDLATIYTMVDMPDTAISILTTILTSPSDLSLNLIKKSPQYQPLLRLPQFGRLTGVALMPRWARPSC